MSRSRAVVPLVVAVALAATFASADAGRVGKAARYEGSSDHEVRPTPGESGDEADEIQARDEAFYAARAFPGRQIPAGALTRARGQAGQLPVTSEVTPVTETPSPTFRSPASPPASGTSPPAKAGPDVAPGGASVPLETAAAAAPVTWAPIGPSPQSTYGPDSGSQYNGQLPLSGRVTMIATHPTDAQTAYAAAAAGGLWKTTNGGSTWAPVFDNLPSLSMGAVAIDPATPTTVWAATGEANQGGDSYYGAGLYRSTDAGSTWSKVGGTQFDYCHLSDIVIKPGTPSTILVAVGQNSGKNGPTTTSCRNGTQSSGGIWRSPDGGASWAQVRPTSGTFDLAAEPSSATTFYAGDYQFGFLRSTDSGATWSTNAGAGFPALSTTGRVVLAAAGGSVVYAGVSGDSDSKLIGLYRSVDGGSNWTFKSAPAGVCEVPATPPAARGQCHYDFVVAVDPGNAATVYLGGIYLVRSTDSGANWTYSGNSLTGSHDIHVDFHAAVFDAQRRLWVGTDGGAYRTPDGVTYTNLNQTLSITQFNTGISGLAQGPLVGGTQDNGSNKYTGSPGWTQYLSGDGGATAMDPAAPSTVYSTYVYLQVSKSVDGGSHNSQLSDPDCLGDGVSACQFYAPIAMDPLRTSTIYAGTKRVWRTTDAWQTNPQPFSPTFGATVTAIAPAPSSASVVYAGTSNGELRVTTDGGANWPDTKGNGLALAWVNDLLVDPASASRAWVVLSGFGHGHVYVTSTAGQAWANISGDLPDTPVNAIAIDQRTSPATLYAGTDAGVFSSSNGGTTWTRYGTGLPNTIVTDVLVDTSANKIVASTHGRGMYTAGIGVQTRPPTNGQIVFERFDGNDWEIYLRGPAGDETQLTNDTAQDYDPVLSPDGTQIAWSSNRDGNYEIYRMSTTGSGVTRLTNSPALDEYPTWSPDGLRVAFDSNRDDANPGSCTNCNYELYSMASSNGAGVTRLTNDPSSDFRPAWSPDGARIAWASTRNGNADLYSNTDDGTGTPVRLTTSAATDTTPAWSPSSTLLAYATTRTDADPAGCNPCNYEIFTLRADGTTATPTQITASAGVDEFPTWSTDGTEIAFSSNRSGDFKLWKASGADGTNPVQLTAVAGADSEPNWQPPATVLPAGGGRYQPLTPARILDTRNGTGGINGPVGPGATVDVQVTGQGGVPATGVTAVAMNVTVTQPGGDGYLTLYPAGSARPLAANLNFTPGKTVPNLVVVKLGAGGKVSMFNSAGSTHVIYDVAGWYSDSPVGNDGRYTALVPARILDTRDGTGGPGAVRLGPGASLDLQVSGRGGVPASGAQAATLNVAVTGTTLTSFLTVFPTGSPRPLAANLNYAAGDTVSNRVMAKLGTSGRVTIYNNAGSADVIVDVGGWFTDASVAGAAGVFTSLSPARILDTRDATGGVTGPIAGGTSVDVQVAGRGGVPATGVSAVILNASVTQPAGGGYLTISPTGTLRPLVSDLNYAPGETRPNLVVVRLGTGGKINLFTSSGAHVVFDVAGWIS